jgi:hypothetical protein
MIGNSSAFNEVKCRAVTDIFKYVLMTQLLKIILDSLNN